MISFSFLCRRAVRLPRVCECERAARRAVVAAVERASSDCRPGRRAHLASVYAPAVRRCTRALRSLRGIQIHAFMRGVLASCAIRTSSVSCSRRLHEECVPTGSDIYRDASARSNLIKYMKNLPSIRQ